MRNKCAAAVLAAGAMWGFIGFFGRVIGSFGIGRFDLIFLSNLSTFVWLLPVILVKDPRLILLPRKDIPLMLLCGLCSSFLFHFCFYTAISIANMSIVAILEYTAPVFAVIFSFFLLHERITGRKLLALLLAFLGSALACWPREQIVLPLAGLLLGLGSGICYALFTVLSRILLDRGLSDYTVAFYNAFLGWAFAALVCHPFAALGCILETPLRVAVFLACGLITGFLPLLLYYYGLKGMEAGTTAILGCMELVVSVLVGIVIFREPFGILSAIGFLLVISAVVVLNWMGRDPKHPSR